VLLETFLYSLIAQIPLVIAAVVLSIVGWRRLAAHNRKAAVWLIAGMATFSARWILGALSIAYSNILIAELRERGGARSDLGPILSLFTLLLAVILIFSLVCFVMAAVSGRHIPDRALAPSNPSVERP
jgi:carbon starvation protein CstA